MARFKEDLGNLRWRNVLACEEVDESFNLFWQDFKTLYNLHFPLKQVKFNKNLYSINKFMTGGLLISRSNKNRLHKLSITSRSIENSTTYRNYRNIYNSVLRASKKIFLEKISNLIVKILKGFGSSLKMHQLAKKRATLSKKSMSMEKL